MLIFLVAFVPVSASGVLDSDDDDSDDSDDVLDPREKARQDKERELKADLNNAADLLGGTALGGAPLALMAQTTRLVSFGPVIVIVA